MKMVRISEKCVLRSDENYFRKSIAFNARTCSSIDLNAQQYIVLQEIESAPVDIETAKLLINSSNEDNGVTFNNLLNEGYLELCEGTSTARAPESPAAIRSAIPVTNSPTQIELCITRRCNQSCVHCNVSAVGLNQPERSTIGFWIQLLDQFVEARVLKVKVTGGEPFVRKGFERFFIELASRPLAVSILTNGTDIPEHLMPIMSENGHTLSISLDGTRPAIHDDFRRMRGAFDATINTMKLLSKHRVTFTINTVLHRDNIRDVEEILAIGEQVGAKAVVATPLGAVGRGASVGASRYYPESNEYDWAIRELKRLAIEYPSDSSVALLNPDERELIEVKRTPGSTPMSRRPPEYCKAGVYAMAVDEDGRAYTCLRGLQERLYSIGNLKEQTLSEVWESRRWAPFRGSSDRKVPCRVEDISQNPELYQLDY